MQETIFIEVNCVGETTGQTYSGQFEMKKYLSHRDIVEASKVSNRLGSGLRRPPSYSIPTLFNIVKSRIDAKLIDSKEIDQISGQIVTDIVSELKDIDPMIDFVNVLSILNSHIVKAPDWWKDAKSEIGGFDLIDYEPAMELNRQLSEAQRPIKKES
jgi:hypothetical protein